MSQNNPSLFTKYNLNLLNATIVKYIPLVLLFTAPLFIFPSPLRALALLLIPLLWWMQKREKGYFIRRTPLDWPILILLLLVLVSLFVIFDLNFSLGKLTGVLFHIAVFYAVIETVKTRRGLNRSLALYLFLSLTVVGLGIIGTKWPLKVGTIAVITNRIPTLLEGLPGAAQGISANQLAGTLLWFFPLSLSIAWTAKRCYQKGDIVVTYAYLLWPLTSIIGVLFVLTQSRGGWLGGICALAFFGSMLYGWVRWLGGITFIGLIITGFSLDWPFISQIMNSDASEATTLGGLGALEFRLELWRAGLWGVADFPLTGMGLGTFREVAPIMYPLTIPPSVDVAHAHNQFLQIALDLGLLGLIAYLAMWLIIAALLFQVMCRPIDPFIKSVALGISSCFVGYFVYALADIVALGAKPGIFWWWLLALSIGLYQANKDETYSMRISVSQTAKDTAI
ncbi:MAG: O-antigen ligase family protein [Chloroflexota bacterium]